MRNHQHPVAIDGHRPACIGRFPVGQASSFGSLPSAEVVLDDVCVTHRISALISAFGVLAGVMLVVACVREYRTGASVLWLVAGAAIFLSALYTLVRDVRRLRTGLPD
ncbi:hypothetical protein [Streptomyces sp. NPDC096142]|uniref:hypothetical protein n=1 Tax=Streptomyces sp. NPDC096142 TaxID=3366077 RepID=UPI003808B99F